MEKLSVFLITKNEEERLPATLKAAADIADELIILDSGSTDNTKVIAEKHGAQFHVRAFDGFGQQKLAAQNLCRHKWVLNIDADEVLSEELKTEIRDFLNDAEKVEHFDGGSIWIKGVLPGEVSPRRFARSYNRIRFYNKTKLAFPEHSTFDNIDFDPAYHIHQFRHIILHYSFLSIKALNQKARTRVQFYFEQEKKGAWLKNLIRLPFEFIFSFVKCYFLRRHFTEGLYGLQNSYIYAKYRHIRILQRVLNRPLINS